jgi:phenylpyruvate tautomerase PptA (4-oxalocrotonate tautomerase family)
MPLINEGHRRSFSGQQKQDIVKELTDAMVRVEGEICAGHRSSLKRWW